MDTFTEDRSFKVGNWIKNKSSTQNFFLEKFTYLVSFTAAFSLFSVLVFLSSVSFYLQSRTFLRKPDGFVDDILL